MKAQKELILRRIAGECILVPTGKAALKIHGMITLTESGALLWERLLSGATAAELTELLLSVYDIDRATAEQDVASFSERLISLGAIEAGEEDE